MNPFHQLEKKLNMYNLNKIRIRNRIFLRTILISLFLEVTFYIEGIIICIFWVDSSFRFHFKMTPLLLLGLYFLVLETRKAFSNVPLKSMRGCIFLYLVLIQIPLQIFSIVFILYIYLHRLGYF